ncbi:MAG: uncharacterized protein KVP18_000258 [Porospora cf. gigantea A]|uniref:uncharacterized protein n=1 Tax=Porospora cf. gigantea A TaxID=2853593 RepID=UPI00355A0C0C|nr:MAG: hypothetical protein KVP18_000258 [Porospora cf. gigantea A]
MFPFAVLHLSLLISIHTDVGFAQDQPPLVGEPPSPTNDCYNQETALTDPPLSLLLGVTSYVSCQQICQLVEKCNAFQFTEKSSTCFLHENPNGPSTPAPGSSSGPKWCPCEQDNRFVGGTLLELGMSANFRVCRETCQTMEKCLYWSFVASDRQCWLFSSRTSTDTLEGAISGAQYCGSECMIHGKAVSLEDGTVRKALLNISPYECEESCQKDAECDLFYYRWYTGLCIFLSEKLEMFDFPGVSLGNSDCDLHVCDLIDASLCYGYCPCEAPITTSTTTDGTASRSEPFDSAVVACVLLVGMVAFVTGVLMLKRRESD